MRSPEPRLIPQRSSGDSFSARTFPPLVVLDYVFDCSVWSQQQLKVASRKMQQVVPLLPAEYRKPGQGQRANAPDDCQSRSQSHVRTRPPEWKKQKRRNRNDGGL